MGWHEFKDLEIADELSQPNSSFFHGRLTADQAIVTGTHTPVQLTSYSDNLGEWDAGNYRFVAQNGGWYHIFLSGRWQQTDGNYYYSLYSLGCDTYARKQSGTSFWVQVTSSIVYVSAGGFIDMKAIHNRGINESLQGSVTLTFMIVKRVA